MFATLKQYKDSSESIKLTLRKSATRINLKIDLETAAKIAALRPALEALIVKATSDPDSISEPSAQDSELMNIVRALSRPNAWKHGLPEEEG